MVRNPFHGSSFRKKTILGGFSWISMVTVIRPLDPQIGFHTLIWKALGCHPRGYLKIPSLKLTAKAPGNGWLEDDCFLVGMGYFQGRTVSFREGILQIFGKYTKKS